MTTGSRAIDAILAGRLERIADNLEVRGRFCADVAASFEPGSKYNVVNDARADACNDAARLVRKMAAEYSARKEGIR